MPRAHASGADRLSYVHEAVGISAALTAALDLGVLARLETGPVNAQDLARDCGLRERGARALLVALAGLGLLDILPDGRYRSALPELGRIVETLADWSALPDVLRNGRPAVAADSPTGAQALYAQAVDLLGRMQESAAAEAVPLLQARAGSALRVLDLGAGAASWSIALAREDPTTRITAVDLPAVLPATARAVADAGVAQCFRLCAGDAFTIELATEYDVVFIANLCHLFDDAANRMLLERAGRALRRGGIIAVIDFLPNERLDGPRWVAVYALGLLMRTRAGQVYPFSTYVRWLRHAGCGQVERHDFASLPASLITAART